MVEPVLHQSSTELVFPITPISPISSSSPPFSFDARHPSPAQQPTMLHRLDTNIEREHLSTPGNSGSSSQTHLPASPPPALLPSKSPLPAHPRSHVLEPTLHVQYMSGPVPTSPLKHAESPSCACLNAHAALLCHQNAQLGQSSSIPLATSLALVTHSTPIWQTLLSCPSCPFSFDGQVLLLAVISIQNVVRTLLQSASSASTSVSSPIHTPNTASASSPSSTHPTDPQLMLGALEITGEDRHSVMALLRSIATTRLASMLHALASLLAQRKTVWALPAPTHIDALLATALAELDMLQAMSPRQQSLKWTCP